MIFCQILQELPPLFTVSYATAGQCGFQNKLCMTASRYKKSRPLQPAYLMV